jgi:hypothetical protein
MQRILLAALSFWLACEAGSKSGRCDGTREAQKKSDD